MSRAIDTRLGRFDKSERLTGIAFGCKVRLRKTVREGGGPNPHQASTITLKGCLMYSGESYILDVHIDGRWAMTHRTTKRAVENKMRRDSKSFQSAMRGMFSSFFKKYSTKGPESLALYNETYDSEQLKECILNGEATRGKVKYTLTSSETTGMMARNGAREFIR